jgi:YggT family protein
MNNPIVHALVFLIDTIFTLYIVAVLLRFFLQTVRANFHNPLCQLIIKATNPVLLPLRRFIPGLWGMDMAALTVAVVLSFINQTLLALLTLGSASKVLAIFVVSLADLLGLIFYIYLFALLIIVVASWFASGGSPVLQALHQLLSPILVRIRKRLPATSGFDFSPLVLGILLVLFNILVVMPVKALGFGMLLG